MTLQEVYCRFPTQADCITQLEKIRWNGAPQCPYCSARQSTAYSAEHRYHCNRCNTTFSVTVKTVFHHTHLPLQKWFLAIALLLDARQHITACQLARNLRVNKNTACSVDQRIRAAMLDIEQRRFIQDLGLKL